MGGTKVRNAPHLQVLRDVPGGNKNTDVINIYVYLALSTEKLSHVNHVNSCSISVKRRNNISLACTSLRAVSTRWFHGAEDMWYATRERGVQHPQSCGSGKQTRGILHCETTETLHFPRICINESLQSTFSKLFSQRNILHLSQIKEHCWIYKSSMVNMPYIPSWLNYILNTAILFLKMLLQTSVIVLFGK